MEQSERFDEVTVQLPEPLGSLEAVNAVVGIPEWWPTGARIAVALASDGQDDREEALIDHVHRILTTRKLLTVRFTLPVGEVADDPTNEDFELLEKAYRAALSILGRDPSAAPSHLFLGGMGLGARVAARLATARLQIDGVFFLSFPLHPSGDPDQARAEYLYRIIPPMLFVQGTQDERCDLPTLRRCLSRVGAPTTLRVIEGAEQTLTSDSMPEDDTARRRTAISEAIAVWMDNLLQGH